MSCKKSVLPYNVLILEPIVNMEKKEREMKAENQSSYFFGKNTSINGILKGYIGNFLEVEHSSSRPWNPIAHCCKSAMFEEFPMQQMLWDC